MEELDIKTAIQIAKILAAAPDERIPMILDVFSKASVDINGLDELAEWRALNKQTALIDTDTFVRELTKGRELTDGEYRIKVPEFNQFCNAKGVSARYARKHLYESGRLRSSTDGGKINYTCDGLQKSILQDGENRTKIYYCHPYSSYERGSNENQNKLVRRKVPKGTNFDDRTEDDIKEVENWINNYPRLLFGWETAQMQFDKELALIA